MPVLLGTRPNGIDKNSSLIEESLDEGGENGATSPEPGPEIPEITVTPPPQTGFSENLAETEGSGRSSISESLLADEVDGVRPRRGRHGRPGGLPDWATWRLLDGIKEIASASAAPDVVGGSASKST